MGEKDLSKKVDTLEKTVQELTEQVSKLTVSLIEFKKANETRSAVEDLKKQVAVVSERVGINKPKSKIIQRVVGNSVNANKPIARPR